MTEIEKLHGLHNTGMTMHERFTMLAQMQIGRRGKRNPFGMRTRSQTMKADLVDALAHQIAYQNRRPMRGFGSRGRGRGRGGMRRFGSEGSLAGMPGLRRQRSNSFGNLSHSSKNLQWRRSNGNLTNMNGSVYSFSSGTSRGSRRGGVMRGRGVRGRARGRGFRGRTHQGRVTRINEPGVPRPPRGYGRRGMRRNLPPAAPAGGWGQARGAQWGRGRGRGGMNRVHTPKPVPTKEELDEQLDQYMAGTKAALDKELDEYMRHAMDFE